MLKHFRLLSRYKQWMNDKLYISVAQSTADELTRKIAALFSAHYRALAEP
jgi:uncharacterized damage-inducible protein DinB